MEKSDLPPRRAALYIRVSTEEQARKGYSLSAQREDLEAYARKLGCEVVGVYADEGKSARKRYTARREFMRMLEDVEADRIDLILFIKLDRWFRSVADYYKVQEILDAHHVAWRTTQEHYDTETTNGRLYINIRLSVAQDECDRDSDRIRFVFDSKVARGEAITGSLPPGLKIEGKRVVPDPGTAQAVRDLFRAYLDCGSAAAAARRVREKWGLPIREHTARRMLRNPLYIGTYRGNPDYCPPLVSPQVFEEAQRLLALRAPRQNQTGRVYLFSGLLFCGACGRPMSGRYAAPRPGRAYYLYRCRGAAVLRQCSHHREMNEEALETCLLERVQGALAGWDIRWDVSPGPRRDRSALLKREKRLRELYLEGLMDLETYRRDLEALEARRPDPPRESRELRSALDAGIPAAYRLLDREHRRAFWHSVLQAVYLDGDNVPRPVFRPPLY